MKKKIDIDRCLDGMRSIYVQGDPKPERKYLIEEAIKLIQSKGSSALSKEYLGIKNYASFGDQRHDTIYGMAPSHGSIVFSIGRIKDVVNPTHVNEIYLLECVRDFGSMTIPNHPNNRNSRYQQDPIFNLVDVLKYYTQLKNNMSYLDHILDISEVDSIQLEFE